MKATASVAYWLIEHEEYDRDVASLAYWGPFDTREEAEAHEFARDPFVCVVELPLDSDEGAA